MTERDGSRFHLRHYSSGQYLRIDEDGAHLADEPGESGKFEFLPILESLKLKQFRNDTVFKIKQSRKFFRFPKKKEGDIKLEISEQCTINHYDAFNFIFPDANQFLELKFCQDANATLKQLIQCL